MPAPNKYAVIRCLTPLFDDLDDFLDQIVLRAIIRIFHTDPNPTNRLLQKVAMRLGRNPSIIMPSIERINQRVKW